MLTITIFAAGLVCLAGVLGLGLWRAQASRAKVSAATAGAARERATDERGITLQTLIVTAVLVLMAVAAGVVIVAITNNAADDLEQQATSIDSQCTRTEIFDPVLAARNIRGRAGTDTAGRDGSAVGCRPVCIYKFNGTDNTKIDTGEISFDRNFDEALSGTALNTASPNAVLVFRNPTKLIAGSGSDIGISAANFPDTGDLDGGVEVRVTPAQDACGVYDDTGKLLWQVREDD